MRDSRAQPSYMNLNSAAQHSSSYTEPQVSPRKNEGLELSLASHATEGTSSYRQRSLSRSEGKLSSFAVAQGLHTPSRAWLDLPTPGARSALSPSNLLSNPMSFSSELPTNWPGSVVRSPNKRKFPHDYFSGAVPAPSLPEKGDHVHQDEGNKRFKEEHNTFRETRSPSGLDIDKDEHDDEQIDQLHEDAVGANQDDDVLATPLRLLAHASDAAASLKQKKKNIVYDNKQDDGRTSGYGAATMGLISPPLVKLPAVRTWLDSKRLANQASSSSKDGKVTLPSFVSTSHRKEHERSSSSATSTHNHTVHFFHPAYLDHAPRGPSTSILPQPNLGVIGRSRSYTAVEGSRRMVPHSSSDIDQMKSKVTSTVTDDERRAEILGVHLDENGNTMDQMGRRKPVTLSTLDHDAWEYRDGRVRSRKSISASLGDEESSSKATTTDSAGLSLSASLPELVSSQADNAIEGESSQSRALTFAGPRPSFSEGQSPRRWQIVQRRASKPDRRSLVSRHQKVLEECASVSDAESDTSEKLGAAHRDFFSMSIYHSKMDNEEDLDPVEQGILSLRELEKLFDIFFHRVNPSVTLFDPFLHSVTYVRARSALLTSVIAALAARLSENERDAKIAVELERHWRQRLLPEALLGGYKSVELSQAFIVLSLYHKPTNKLSEDRSWQYLGFAIRIATEIGVNRLTQASDEVKDNEQVRRRMRNRARLWISLYLSDRALSMQTGRNSTLLEDDFLAHADLWHREDFALPGDARLISLLKMKRIITTACRLHDEVVAHSHVPVDDKTDTHATFYNAHECIKTLNFQRFQINAELDRWQDVWCVRSLDDDANGIESLAIGQFLLKWRPRALIDLWYARLHINSMYLETIERFFQFMKAANIALHGESQQHSHDDAEPASRSTTAEDAFRAPFLETEKVLDKVSFDCWQASIHLMDTVLNDLPEDEVTNAPNALSIKVIYSALAALRLGSPNDRHNRPWADQNQVIPRCKRLVDLLITAGQTPAHRNGAAAPFGSYLKGIVSLWDSENNSVATVDSDKPPQEMASSQFGPLASAVQEDKPASEIVGKASVSTLHKGLVNPITSVKPVSNGQIPSLPTVVGTPTQLHSVGDDIWGTSVGRRTRTFSSTGADGQRDSDPEAVDRMWDYLTTYSDSVSHFPVSLWQQQTSGNPPLTPSGMPVNAMATILSSNSNIEAASPHGQSAHAKVQPSPL